MGVEPAPEEQTLPESSGRHLGGKQCVYPQSACHGKRVVLNQVSSEAVQGIQYEIGFWKSCRMHIQVSETVDPQCVPVEDEDMTEASVPAAQDNGERRITDLKTQKTKSTLLNKLTWIKFCFFSFS